MRLVQYETQRFGGYPLFRKKIREAGKFFFEMARYPLVVCWLTVGKASINKGADAPRTVAMRADRREACIATVRGYGADVAIASLISYHLLSVFYSITLKKYNKFSDSGFLKNEPSILILFKSISSKISKLLLPLDSILVGISDKNWHSSLKPKLPV